MGNYSGNIAIFLLMSTLRKSVSSNEMYSQGNNPFESFNKSKQLPYSPGMNLSDKIDMITYSLLEETPLNGSGATNDYSDTTENIYNYSYNNDYYDYGDEYTYPVFTFEKPMYLYIWGILVILTLLVNIIVLYVLMRRERKARHVILAAVAISDTLTGLTTLPTYIIVYQHQLQTTYYDNNFNNSTVNETTTFPSFLTATDMLSNQYFGIFTSSNKTNNLSSVSSKSMYNGITELNYELYDTQPPIYWYNLTKGLCLGFMISKYFLSKLFHTMSIFFTLLLAIQRYVSIAFPTKVQSMFTVKETITYICVITFLISPALHVYHLTTGKAIDGTCQWSLTEDECGVDCIYLWVLFFIRHFVPCVSLTTLTILFIKHLRNMPLSRKTYKTRRILIIVIAVVIMFLVPEIPYGIFLLYSAIEQTANKGKNFDLETNRAIHMTYEILLVLSFNANFYIYTFFDKEFRKSLQRTLFRPLLCGNTRRFSFYRTSTSSEHATKSTNCSTSRGALELTATQTSNSDRSVTIDP